MTRPGVDRMFKAFSDPIRLRILNLLRDGELCVCDLVAILRVPQPTASRHLAYLRRAGLVNSHRRGYWTYYTLVPGRTKFHRKLLECLESCFEDVHALAKDAARAHSVRAKGGCCPR